MKLFRSFSNEPDGGGGVPLANLAGVHHGLPGGFLLLNHLPSHCVAGSAEAPDVCFAFAVWVKAFGFLHSPSFFIIPHQSKLFVCVVHPIESLNLLYFSIRSSATDNIFPYRFAWR